jgi:hypothetical protein
MERKDDYRKLNKQIKVDGLPTPSVEHAFQYLADAKYFTILDLNSAFHQIPLSENSKKFTAFVTPFGIYQYNRLPFGFANSPQVFTRHIDEVLGDLKYSCVYPYIDDLCIYSKSADDHLRHVEAVLSRLRVAGLTVCEDKIELCVQSLTFLGHLISDEKLQVDPDRVTPIENFPDPRTVKEVARYLGLCGFYSKFIPRYSEISMPLNRLKRKNVSF